MIKVRVCLAPGDSASPGPAAPAGPGGVAGACQWAGPQLEHVVRFVPVGTTELSPAVPGTLPVSGRAPVTVPAHPSHGPPAQPVPSGPPAEAHDGRPDEATRVAGGRPLSYPSRAWKSSVHHTKRHRGASQQQLHLTPNADHTGLRAAARNPAVCHGPTDPALGRPAKQHDPPCERRAGQESQDRCRGRDSASRNPAGATRGEGTRAAGGAAQGRDRGSPASAVAAGGAWGGGVVLRQLLHPQPLVRVVRRRIAPPPCQVAGGAAHRPVVDSDSEQQLRFVLTYLPHVGLGAGNSPPRSKNGLRKLRWRSTLTVGQPEQRIRRGGARV